MMRSLSTIGLALAAAAGLAAPARSQEVPPPARGPREGGAPGAIQQRWRELRETRREAREAFRAFLDQNPDLRRRLEERRGAFREALRDRAQEMRTRGGGPRLGPHQGLRPFRGGIGARRLGRFEGRFVPERRFPGMRRGPGGPRRRSL